MYSPGIYATAETQFEGQLYYQYFTTPIDNTDVSCKTFKVIAQRFSPDFTIPIFATECAIDGHCFTVLSSNFLQLDHQPEVYLITPFEFAGLSLTQTSKFSVTEVRG